MIHDFEIEAIRFLVLHLVVGVAAGVMLGILLLAFDVFGLGSLVWESANPLLPLMLLFFGLFITFGSVGMGVGVMSLAEDRN